MTLVELVLEREDANTETALLAEWLVEDGATVRRGEAVCLVETSKASVELEAPAAGTLVHLYPAGADVEPGRTLALLASGREELEEALARRDAVAAPPAPAAPAGGRRRATRKALEAAERHGVDLEEIEVDGFVTAEDVEAFLRARAASPGGPPARAPQPGLGGLSTDGVTLPASFAGDETVGVLDPSFLAQLHADPDGFRALPPEHKTRVLAEHGARVGEDVVLEEGTLVAAPRIVLGDRVRIGRDATVRCEEVVAVGELTHVGPGLELTCRRAYVGAGVHAGRSIRIGGGGHRDPWAVLAIGDLAFVGDEVFVNPCRPVLIGAEVFLTMRAVIVTHNIGHSVLEGFENRFAPVVLEDRAQVGIGSVVYAGCRIGREAIVASGSYVVADVPAGKLAIGVPARVAGDARRPPGRARQVELARRIVEGLLELLVLRGHPASPSSAGPDRGLELTRPDGVHRALFVERLEDAAGLRGDAAELVVLTLEYRGGEPPAGCAVLDLLGRRVHGTGSALLDAAREYCRKQGIRFEPGPWRYRDGLV